jgi:hypothetical protein
MIPLRFAPKNIKTSENFQKKCMMYVYKNNPYTYMKAIPPSIYRITGAVGCILGFTASVYITDDIKVRNPSDFAFKSFTVLTHTIMGGMCGVTLTPAIPALVVASAAYYILGKEKKEV